MPRMTLRARVTQLEAMVAERDRRIAHLESRAARAPTLQENERTLTMSEAARLYCQETGKRSVTPDELRSWRRAHLHGAN